MKYKIAKKIDMGYVKKINAFLSTFYNSSRDLPNFRLHNFHFSNNVNSSVSSSESIFSLIVAHLSDRRCTVLALRRHHAGVETKLCVLKLLRR